MLNFHTDDSSTWVLSDEVLLSAIRWRRNHSASAKAAAKAGPEAFATWLGKPKSLPVWPKNRSGVSPLMQTLWSQHAFESTGRSQTVAGVLEHFAADTAKKTRTKMLGMLLNEFDGSQPCQPFELLALLGLLQHARTELPTRLRLRLFRVVLLAARDFAVEIDATPPGVEPADAHLVRRGELPLLIGRLFASVQGSSHLRAGGRQTLSQLLDEETDTDGTPHGRILERLPLFLASLTRSVASQPKSGRPTFHAADQKRFASLVRETTLQAGADGTVPLSKQNVFAPGSLIHASIEAAALPARDPARRAAAVIPNEFVKVKPKASTKANPKFSVASGQSEWGGVATFRGDFAKPRFVMTADFHGPCPRLAMQLDRQSVLSGDWRFDVQVGGEPLPEPTCWSSVCWFSDDEADYLEIQAELDGGIQLTRHLIYTHDDSLVILAAAVRNTGNATVSGTATFALADNVRAVADKNDRLVHLKAPVPARVVPLGLAADPFESTSGSISAAGQRIEVTQANPSDGLCIAVAVDLDPKHKQRRQIEWRRLTVASGGRVVPRGLADAWRLRLGYHEDSPQWVYYQGLSPVDGTRTVLGHHTFYEMVFGRFEDGEIDPLVHVENE